MRPDERPGQPCPNQGVVLIGTAETARFLDWAVEGATDAARIFGVVLAGRADAYAGPRPVLGTLEDLPRLAEILQPTTAVVCLPSGEGHRRAADLLKASGLAARFIPPPGEWFTPEARPGSSASLSTGAPRIDLLDLIGRRPHGIDRAAVARILAGKRVLITGAGGSIGSEIARICAAYGPAQLILMERAENALFEIDRQLKERFPGVARRAVLHDVVEAEATLRLLVELRPEVVFHAAAHKHVPLMEDHPAHALTNNFFGTRSIADAALAVGAERFVMISSDKAVNPTSVMGATKRLAEMYIQGLHRESRDRARARATRFSMVRFGNVLGSACSVLPIWSAQLADGGPLTVTDARMTRYFMTINEAAALVIQAAAIEEEAHSAAVYVLDMGEPVNILELARRFVRAHGLEPRVVAAGTAAAEPGPSAGAADIVLTGSRPGEKLHEELAYDAEQLRATPCAGIRAWGGFLGEDFNFASLVADLSAARISTDRAAVLAAIRRNVPEMKAGSEQTTTEQKPESTSSARTAAA